MAKFTERLNQLVASLDSINFEGRNDLVEIKNAFELSKLTVSDVSPFIFFDCNRYQRSTVVRRKDYELIVMTWLPGQSSVPHDHAASTCAIRVLQGSAIEQNFRLADDGYVEAEFETEICTGEISGTNDTGIHSIRNCKFANKPLVTAHVYAPPLRDFRCFEPRPTLSKVSSFTQSNPGNPLKVIVVGGGFSGTMTAAQILHRASLAGQNVHVRVIERRGILGEGVAYGTRDESHLLNVPANRMSAWPDRGDDFVNWVRENKNVSGVTFLPRKWYAEYIRQSLLKTSEQANPNCSLSLCMDEVRRIVRKPGGGWLVHYSREASDVADLVVLAIGHHCPGDPFANKWQGQRDRMIMNPWQAVALNQIAHDDKIVIVGSGLTAIDVVLSLAQRQHTGHITLVSRHGLIPQVHETRQTNSLHLHEFVDSMLQATNPIRIATVVKKTRSLIAKMEMQGTHWQSVLDSLRVHIPRIWQALPTRERQKFIDRIRPYWEVHRHRMPPQAWETFTRLQSQKQLDVVAGSFASARADNSTIELIIKKQNDQKATMSVKANWVINCTGPRASNSVESNPAISSLLSKGLLQTDVFELGVETDESGHALDRYGNVVNDLFIIGTLRKPAFWESTAVPELRVQASSIGTQVAHFQKKPGTPGNSVLALQH